jgi:hypothetical protein
MSSNKSDRHDIGTAKKGKSINSSKTLFSRSIRYGSVESSDQLLSILPSPVSTDLPSWHNLVTYNDDADQQSRLLNKTPSEIQLQSFQGSESDKDVYLHDLGYQVRKKQQRRQVYACFIALCLVFVGYLSFKPASPKQYIEPTITEGPLSTLDPVEDLGIHAFERPSFSLPPHAVKGSRGDHKGPFPTNSWYQNLIMVDDEPSSVNLAYSLPYLIDVVGPTPGIRLHVTHTTASTDVVQLNINENLGLTIGAGFDVNSESEDTKSRKYYVRDMSPLAVSLEWVSGWCSCDIIVFLYLLTCLCLYFFISLPLLPLILLLSSFSTLLSVLLSLLPTF